MLWKKIEFRVRQWATQFSVHSPIILLQLKCSFSWNMILSSSTISYRYEDPWSGWSKTEIFPSYYFPSLSTHSYELLWRKTAIGTNPTFVVVRAYRPLWCAFNGWNSWHKSIYMGLLLSASLSQNALLVTIVGLM